jgi:hydroxymethylpyrimidine/phosphomethylpyrimidine kinase
MTAAVFRSDQKCLPVVLTIAGSDSSGGAGLQADLKTFSAQRCYGASAVTALTAQNTTGVKAVAPCPPDVVAAQIEAVLADLPVAAAKTGMLVDEPTILAVARALAGTVFPLVVDPVLVSKSGDPLLADDAVAALLEHIVPLAAVVTPNLPEATRLTGVPLPLAADGLPRDDDLRAAGDVLLRRGARAVLLKGGHGSGELVVDVLVVAAGVQRFSSPRIASKHTHGTGCTLSASMAALLARGFPLEAAVARSIAYVNQAIAQAPGLGQGQGPLHHLHPFFPSRP